MWYWRFLFLLHHVEILHTRIRPKWLSTFRYLFLLKLVRLDAMNLGQFMERALFLWFFLFLYKVALRVHYRNHQHIVFHSHYSVISWDYLITNKLTSQGILRSHKSTHIVKILKDIGVSLDLLPSTTSCNHYCKFFLIYSKFFVPIVICIRFQISTLVLIISSTLLSIWLCIYLSLCHVVSVSNCWLWNSSSLRFQVARLLLFRRVLSFSEIAQFDQFFLYLVERVNSFQFR